MIILTKAQRQALKQVYHRAVKAYAMGPERFGVHFMNYRAFRRKVQSGPGCILIPFAGMQLGIEPDGHTHS